MRYSFYLILLLGFCVLFSVVQGAERAQVMVVLDASGSMWKRIDNKEKILIAREVIGGILQDWNENTDLGLIAYGHRRKGDCSDIETVVPVGPADTQAIGKIVNRISPKGKTPLSAAVMKAAEELRYTEEKATVILISDGKETCDMDPCAVGKELEAAGVNFTAHVIGFDLSEKEKQQLQCLAENTGGQYYDAQKAEELKVALAEAVEQVETQPDQPEQAEPDQALAVLLAPDTASLGKVIEIEWEGPDGKGDYLTVVTPDTPDNKHGKYAYTKKGNPAKLPVPDKPGIYELRYISAQSNTALARRPITVSEVTVNISAPESAPIGKLLDISWEGPNNKGDYLTVVTPDTPDHKHGKYAYTKKGNPAKLPIPDKPGAYELRYISAQSNIVLARRAITIAEVTVSLDAPESALAGKTLEVGWEGPNNKGDYLTVVTPDTPDNKHGKYAYTKNGHPAKLSIPDKPGVYELRYISAQSNIALARRSITATEITAQLNALDVVPLKQAIRLDWQGPDNKGDYLTVVTLDTPDNKHGKYAYTKNGNPAKLQIPDKPGVYELRYISNQSKIVLSRRPIKVVAEAEMSDYTTAAPQGTVKLQVVNASSGQPVSEGLSWTVYDLKGGNMQNSTEAQPQFSFPPGIYRANVTVQSTSKSLDFILNSGENLVRSLTVE